jgi:hypothetical protein
MPEDNMYASLEGRLTRVLEWDMCANTVTYANLYTLLNIKFLHLLTAGLRACLSGVCVC